jgi:hypothetical protein
MKLIYSAVVLRCGCIIDKLYPLASMSITGETVPRSVSAVSADSAQLSGVIDAYPE